MSPRLEPTAQTSVGAVALTDNRASRVVATGGDHAVPFQWTIIPSMPTAQTSSAALPHTATAWSAIVALAWDQAVPSQCEMPVVNPAAQTSFGPLPQRPLTLALGTVMSGPHEVPW